MDSELRKCDILKTIYICSEQNDLIYRIVFHIVFVTRLLCGFVLKHMVVKPINTTVSLEVHNPVADKKVEVHYNISMHINFN